MNIYSVRQAIYLSHTFQSFPHFPDDENDHESLGDTLRLKQLLIDWLGAGLQFWYLSEVGN